MTVRYGTSDSDNTQFSLGTSEDVGRAAGCPSGDGERPPNQQPSPVPSVKKYEQTFGGTNDSYQQSTFVVISDDHEVDDSESISRYWRRFEVELPDSTTTSDSGDSSFEEQQNKTKSRQTTLFPMTMTYMDDQHVRLRFIRRVYGILALQMLFTIAMCALIALYVPARNFCLGPTGLALYCVSMISILAIILALYFHKHSFPYNVCLLGIFTLFMSYMVGTIAAYFETQGAGEMLVESLFITATVFLGLTLFTLQSKINFSFLGAGLGMGLWIVILWSFLGMIFGIQTGSVYALLGSLLFSAYIIFDTYMIAERLHPSECFVAAIELYLDLVNLFMYILRLLASIHQS